jgi:sulfur-carrier protein
MKVHIPTPLLWYTNAKEVDANGVTLAELFADLDRRYPGLRFRVVNEQGKLREHIKVFVNRQIVEDMNASLQPDDHVHIITAISGGNLKLVT